MSDKDRFVCAQGRSFPFQEKDFTEDYHFICVADPQLGLLHNKKETITWDEEMACLERTVEHINRLKPVFVIFLGDLTHADADASEESASMQAQQVSDLKRILGGIDEAIPLLFLSGNHDIGEDITENSLRLYRERFGDDYFTFRCNGMRAVVLNTQAFVSQNALSKEIAQAQLAFMEEALSDDTAVHKVVFGHVSPFLFDADEPHDTFNLPKEPRAKLLSVAQSACVTHWFSGHFHRNAVATTPTASGKGKEGAADDSAPVLESVTSSSCGTQAITGDESEILGLKGITGLAIGEDKSGIRIVKVTKAKGLSHEWYPLNAVPDKITF